MPFVTGRAFGFTYLSRDPLWPFGITVENLIPDEICKKRVVFPACTAINLQLAERRLKARQQSLFRRETCIDGNDYCRTHSAGFLSREKYECAKITIVTARARVMTGTSPCFLSYMIYDERRRKPRHRSIRVRGSIYSPRSRTLRSTLRTHLFIRHHGEPIPRLFRELAFFGFAG